jgi:hypothetical protein
MRPRGISCIGMNGGIMRLTFVESFEMDSPDSPWTPAFISGDVDFSGLASDFPGRELASRLLSHKALFLETYGDEGTEYALLDPVGL